MQKIEPQAEIELEGAEAAQMLKPYGAGIDTRSKFIAVCLRADVTRCSRRKSSRENGAGRKRVQGRIGQHELGINETGEANVEVRNNL
jgi:hypothetical protein